MRFLQTHNSAKPYKVAFENETESFTAIEPKADGIANSTEGNDSDPQLSTVMLVDDYKCQGLALAAASEDTEDLAERLSLLRKARVSFQLALDESLEYKAAQCIQGWEQLQRDQLELRESSSSDRSSDSHEELVSASVVHLLEGGALDDATELLRSWCHRSRLQKLSNRVNRLRMNSLSI